MIKSRVLVVGAFPPKGHEIIGGVVTVCAALNESSFSDLFDLDLIDSTQISNPPPHFIIRLGLAIKRFFYFIRQLATRRPDAVLLFASDGFSLAEKSLMARIARLCGCPAILFPQAGRIMDQYQQSILHRAWMSLALKSADKFLCQGPTWQRFALEQLGVSADNAPIVYNWSASQAKLDIGEARFLRPEPAKVRFLFLGWLERKKGIFELLSAVAELSKTHAFELVVAGRGHAEDEAKQFVASNRLAEIVSFVGWVQGPELDAILSNTDVLVLPSWYEGFPNAIIEAMAAGQAVVVSAVGNIPDMISDGHEALLVPPRNAEFLAATMRRILDDGELRNLLAFNGHELARRQFSVEPAVDRLAGIVHDAIGA